MERLLTAVDRAIRGMSAMWGGNHRLWREDLRPELGPGRRPLSLAEFLRRGWLSLALALPLVAPAAAETPIRIGWQTGDVNLLLSAAVATKKFEHEGLVPELKAFPGGGPALLPAFAASEIDIGFMGEIPAVIGYANGLPISIFMVLETYPSNVRLIVNPKQIKIMQDLKGKKIAVTFGSTSHFHALLALASAKLSQSDVTLVNMGPANMPGAYEAGQIDAAVAWEPSAGELEKLGGQRIATTESLGTIVSYVCVARQAYLQEHPDAIEKFLQIWETTTRDYLSNPAQVSSFEAKRMGKSPEEFAQLVARQNPTRPTFAEQLTNTYIGSPSAKDQSRFMKHVEGVGQFLLKLDRVHSLPASWDGLLDPRPIATYVAQHGK